VLDPAARQLQHTVAIASSCHCCCCVFFGMVAIGAEVAYVDMTSSLQTYMVLRATTQMQSDLLNDTVNMFTKVLPAHHPSRSKSCVAAHSPLCSRRYHLWSADSAATGEASGDGGSRCIGDGCSSRRWWHHACESFAAHEPTTRSVTIHTFVLSTYPKLALVAP
jgi:hypothetical protein